MVGGGRYSRDEAGEEVPDAFLLPHAALGRRVVAVGQAE